jgi:hypothetical protein
VEDVIKLIQGSNSPFRGKLGIENQNNNIEDQQSEPNHNFYHKRSKSLVNFNKMVGRDPKTQENSKQNTNYKDNIVNHSRNFSNFFRSQSTLLQSNDEIYVSDGQQNKELK